MCNGSGEEKGGCGSAGLRDAGKVLQARRSRGRERRAEMQHDVRTTQQDRPLASSLSSMATSQMSWAAGQHMSFLDTSIGDDASTEDGVMASILSIDS